jgi:hypothetical protein
MRWKCGRSSSAPMCSDSSRSTKVANSSASTAALDTPITLVMHTWPPSLVSAPGLPSCTSQAGRGYADKPARSTATYHRACGARGGAGGYEELGDGAGFAAAVAAGSRSGRQVAGHGQSARPPHRHHHLRPHCHRRRVRSHAVSRDGRDVDREVYTCLNGPHTRPGRAARSTRTGGAGRQAHDLAGLARRLGVAARQYHVGALLELLLRLLPARASATPPFTTGPPGAHSVHTSGLARRWWRWRRRSGGSVWIESLLATKTVLF